MFQFSGFNLLFPNGLRSFQVTYKCFSVSMLPGNQRLDVERGGKIIMPPSALDMLTRLNVDYPMLFKLTNSEKERSSYAGVLEFIADEGKCYLPYWMMNNMLLEEGGFIIIESVSLPIATFSKFQPHSSDFLDITNPKAVLENALRGYACLTKGDNISIQYNHKVYELSVLETKPGNAVSIIECDMNVEFEAPIDYKESSHAKEIEPNDADDNTNEDVASFAGSGIRLDGKRKKEAQMQTPRTKKSMAHGVPDYKSPYGLLKFDRTVKPISDRVVSDDTKENTDSNGSGFQGAGFTMK